jgi:N-acetylglucosamine-6-phosphate deacetylase
VGHSGIDGDVALRDAINAGWISGPRLQAAGRKITGIGGQATTLQSAVAAQILAQEFLTVSGPDQARDEGMPGIDIIRSSTMNAAELMGWADRVGELAAGKFADIIAVEGDPVQHIGLLQHVQFVMKGAMVVRNDFARR